MPAAPVLDSHALLALLRDEPGGESVADLLERAGRRDQPVHRTELNYTEVQYITRRKDGYAAWATIANELRAAPIEFHPATRRLADLAADFKARFKISLATARLGEHRRETPTRLTDKSAAEKRRRWRD